jgi:hypothetical protein
MHEQPAVIAKRVAVDPRRRGPGGSPDMSEEQPGPDLLRQGAEIEVVPGRHGIAVQARLQQVAIPSQTEAVAIGRRRAALGGKRLVDQ